METHRIIDLTIAVVYLIAITALGLYASRKEMSTKEGYFLGGKSFKWYIVGASLFATHISSMQFIGQSGFAYDIGIAAANPQLLGALTLGISAAYFIPLYLRQGMYTVPKYLELRFNKRIKVAYSGIIVFTTLLNSPFALYAAGLAAIELLGFDRSYLPHLCFIIGATVGLYSVIGGLKSVVVTDFVQTIILMGGGIAVLVLGIQHAGGLSTVISTVRDTHLELLLPSDHSQMPWTVVVSGMLIGSIAWSTSDSSVLQRVLGAKDLKAARQGMAFCSVLKILAVFIIACPGIIAACLYADIAPDTAYPRLVADVLPVGISGLVMAGLLAALMSSADSGLTNVSSLVAIEIWPAVNRKASDSSSLKVGRITGIFHLSVSVIAAPFVGELGLIFPLVLKIAGYMLGPLGLIFIVSRIVKRVNEQSAFTVMVIGFLIGVYMTVGTTFSSFEWMVPEAVLETSFFEIQTYLAFFYAIVLVGVSLITPPPSREQIDFLALKEEEKALANGSSFFTSSVFWYGLIVATIIGLYIIF